ncbi:unnamed protein product [Colletotrichum noveboracense]|uniref:C2H2-type domain-containing protein n=1 Tax=Colletotrichum noveboracense TaxID=2664923 RepID=A0A9W4S1L2_9PEZI|nr:unnamed protein product [Colletotrichum noveboracense]
MAIRFGAVDARTFDELCNKTLAKTVPLVDWVHPLRPVFPQFSTSCEVQLDKPSTRGSTSWAVKNFTAAVGLKERFKPHDLRHGAGVDVNNLQYLPVRNEFHTREALGHSWQALQNGTTHKGDDHYPLQTAIRMLPEIVDDTSIASPVLDFEIPSLNTPTTSDIGITPAATSASTPPATTTGTPSMIAPTDVDDAGIRDFLGFSEVDTQIDDPTQQQLENVHKLDLPKSTTLFIDYLAKLPERARPRSKKPMFGEAQPGKFNCPDNDCDRAFKTAKQLVLHINLDHPGTPIPDNANEEIIRPIKCDICGRRFTDSGRFRVHATSCSRKRSAPSPHDDDDDDDVSMPSLSKGSDAVDKASVEQNKKPKLETNEVSIANEYASLLGQDIELVVVDTVSNSGRPLHFSQGVGNEGTVQAPGEAKCVDSYDTRSQEPLLLPLCLLSSASWEVCTQTLSKTLTFSRLNWSLAASLPTLKNFIAVVNNPQDVPVRNEFHTKEALGQSWHAFQTGKTHMYSGHRKIYYWNL